MLRPWPCCFQLTFAVLPRYRPPRSCEYGFILSGASLPLQSSSPLQTCPLPLRAPSTFPGVPLPIATTTRGVHQSASFLSSPSFRPQRFSRSRRFTPPRTLRAYFIPLPRPGFTFQGFSSLPGRLASSTRRPLMLIHDLRLQPPKQLSSSDRVTFRGLNPGSDPLRQTEWLTLPTARSPLKFSPLRVYLRTP